MMVLHICNAFQTNPMYLDLFQRLEKEGFVQEVLSPGTRETLSSKEGESIVLHYFKRSSSIINRLLWRKRITSLIDHIEHTVNCSSIELIHAHTLFSDGAVAYGLYKKYGVPYIVAVRNTDLNIFFKYMIWEKTLGYSILRNASKVILISYSNKQQLYHTIPQSVIKQIDSKVEIIPNGINKFWLSNIYHRPCKNSEDIRLTYIGDICPNKNIDGTLRAVKKLRNQINISYTVIGDKKDETSNYLCRIRSYSQKYTFFDIRERYNKEQLLQFFRNNTDIFIMNSHKETFGLSYIEALTQGIPIIYSKDQGIDGFFEEGKVGFHAESNSVDNIADAILKVRHNYNSLLESIKHINFENFDWDSIAIRYKELYYSILQEA